MNRMFVFFATVFVFVCFLLLLLLLFVYVCDRAELLSE